MFYFVNSQLIKKQLKKTPNEYYMERFFFHKFWINFELTEKKYWKLPPQKLTNLIPGCITG